MSTLPTGYSSEDLQIKKNPLAATARGSPDLLLSILLFNTFKILCSFNREQNMLHSKAHFRAC